MSANNESVIQSFRQFLETYRSPTTGPPSADVSTVQVPDLSSDHFQTVVLRGRTNTDSCFFSDHTIGPEDVEPEVFDWVYYHLDYKKCPYPLAFALASIVARKLGLAATASESHSCEADKSKPAISSNELYSQSLEYLTEYINSWKENPEIAVEIAKEYSSQPFPSSLAAIKNSRRKMEDRHVVLHDLNKALSLKSANQYSYYAIFDGHAGVDAASYASAHLHYNLVKSQAFLDGDIPSAFKEAFSITDLHYLERSAREGKKSGSTALCALIENKSKLFVAWLGDSQALLVRNGKPIDIMIPHKPELEEERKRIEELGGFVAFVDTWRVNGTLAVSRAIGDPEHKPYISSEPDVVQLAIDSDTDFLIMACDGLWDQLTPEEATSLAFDYICKHEEQDIDQLSQNLAAYLSKMAKDDGSSDNITTFVIFFKDLEQLRATPFTPLTPRERNETNGLNGNHFQFNELEFLQSNAKNPFDLSSEPSLQWTSESFDQMNNAKLNFEISDSITSAEESSHDSRKDSNQNPFVTNDYSIADLNNENKLFDISVDNNFNHNESSLLKQTLNSYDINDTKAESDISQTLENNCSNELQSLQTDSQLNISKLSDISSSFPTQAVSHSDHALCSTPVQSLQTAEEFSINSIPNESIILEEPMEAKRTPDLPTTGMSDQDFMKGPIVTNADVSVGESVVDSFISANSSLEESSTTFEKSGYQTAFENEMSSQLEESTPTKSPLHLEEICDQVFANIEEVNYNKENCDNQDNNDNDSSSDGESVDSFCYEKISSDMTAITKRVENDFPFQQTYDSPPMGSDQQIIPQNEEFKDESETEGLIQTEVSSEKAYTDETPALSSCAQTNEEVQHVMAEEERVEKVEESKEVISYQSIEKTSLTSPNDICDQTQSDPPKDVCFDSLIVETEPKESEIDTNYSYADLNDKQFDSSVGNHFNNESSLMKEATISFEMDTENTKTQLFDVKASDDNLDNDLQNLQKDIDVNIGHEISETLLFPTEEFIQPTDSPIPYQDQDISEDFSNISETKINNNGDVPPEVDLIGSDIKQDEPDLCIPIESTFVQSMAAIDAQCQQKFELSDDLMPNELVLESEIKPIENMSSPTSEPLPEVKETENKLSEPAVDLLEEPIITEKPLEVSTNGNKEVERPLSPQIIIETKQLTDALEPSVTPIKEVENLVENISEEPKNLMNEEISNVMNDSAIETKPESSIETKLETENLTNGGTSTETVGTEPKEQKIDSKPEVSGAIKTTKPTSAVRSETKSSKPISKPSSSSAPKAAVPSKSPLPSKMVPKAAPATRKPLSATKTVGTTSTTRPTATKTTATSRVTSSVPPTKPIARTTTARPPGTSVASTKPQAPTTRTTTAATTTAKPKVGLIRPQTTTSSAPRVAATRTVPARPATSTLSSTGALKKPVSSSTSTGTTRPPTKPLSSIGSSAVNKASSTTSTTGVAKKPVSTLGPRRAPLASTQTKSSQSTTNGIKSTVNSTKAPVKSSAAVSRTNTGRTIGTASAKSSVTTTATASRTTTTTTTTSSMASVVSKNNNKLNVGNSLKQELEDALSQPIPTTQ